MTAVGLSGCDPVLNIAGTHFPAWLLCAVAGALGVALLRPLFLAVRIEVYLWLLPLVTVFPLYVLLRQLLQHGNGGRGRLTNTRVFLRPWLVNFFLLPVGQDYHLPHHLFASIPHYRLRRLHLAMLAYDDYRAAAVED